MTPADAEVSVAELQHAYRTLQHDVRTRRSSRGGSTLALAKEDTRLDVRVLNDSSTTVGAAVPSAWIAVVAAHAGAGASITALAVADAAAGDGRAVHLIEAAGPARSGLLTASSSELGLDDTGTWRRGRRGSVLIDRRMSDDRATAWPSPTGDGVETTIVDLGLLSETCLRQAVAGRAGCVVVTRPTVPGVRSTEQLLNTLADARVAVAVVGGGRWPSEVTSGLGPRLRRLRKDGRVVTVPLARRVETSGPTSTPLPRDLVAASRALLNVLDVAAPDDATTATPHTPRPEGTPR
ncbi:hypothetical protein ACXR2U_01030 [Jatrophihabitans sp. YIM 134969]